VSVQCRAHILRDYRVGAAMGGDEFGRGQMDAERRRNYAAFTCLLFSRQDSRLYCGITAYDADIFYAFDTETHEWESLGWRDVGGEFDVKIHRSLIFDETDQAIYGATACLHDVSRRLEAPGGKIFRYMPATGEYEVLSTPIEYDYIQTISMDHERRVIYGLTYPVFKFFRYDIDTDTVTNFDFIGSTLGELIRLDPRTASCKFLGKPYASRRMPGLILGEDGLIYGCGGDEGNGQLFCYDRQSEAFHSLGEMYDPDLDTACYRTHDIVRGEGNVFYVAETDNPRRPRPPASR